MGTEGHRLPGAFDRVVGSRRYLTRRLNEDGWREIFEVEIADGRTSAEMYSRLAEIQDKPPRLFLVVEGGREGSAKPFGEPD